MKKIISILFLVFGFNPLLAQNGLRGVYFNGTNFEKKVFIRNDPKIDFNWGLSGPKPGLVNKYEYSIRWTGWLTAPVSGKYGFSALVDDGFRVWINNVLVMDSWALHNSDAFKKYVMLTEGKSYPIKIEYFNAMLHGVFKLYWTVPNQEISTIDNKYFLLKAPQKTAEPIVTLDEKPIIDEKKVSKPKIENPKEVKKVELKKDTSKPQIPKSLILQETDADPKSKVVFFEIGTETFTENSNLKLDKLLKYLLAHPAKSVKLMGHTDVIGDKIKNQELSQKRAEILANYLIAKGIDGKRIEKMGFGAEKPIFQKPQTEAEHATNRRVEFEFFEQ